jgi:mono/diheme cytochrome c family protein
MRLRVTRRIRHAGVMLGTCFVLLAAAAAAASGQLPRQRSSPAAAADGARVFRTYCAACHGATATGAGPAAIAMKVTPPNLTRIAARNNGMFPAERVRQIIQGRGPAAHGERNMPVWGDVFARKEPGTTPAALIDALVRYLDALQERPA